MSNFKKVAIIKKEIVKLNDIIDEKIIRGLSYRDEARRHKFLREQKRAIFRASFFKNPMRFISTFLF